MANMSTRHLQLPALGLYKIGAVKSQILDWGWVHGALAFPAELLLTDGLLMDSTGGIVIVFSFVLTGKPSRLQQKLPKVWLYNEPWLKSVSQKI